MGALETGELLILTAYSHGYRWGWEALLVRPATGALVERHDAGARYASQHAAQEAGVTFCTRYFQALPQVMRVNALTLSGRRLDTGGW